MFAENVENDRLPRAHDVGLRIVENPIDVLVSSDEVKIEIWEKGYGLLLAKSCKGGVGVLAQLVQGERCAKREPTRIGVVEHES